MKKYSRKHSRNHSRYHSRNISRKLSRMYSRKHSRKHSRQHSRKLSRKLSRVGQAPQYTRYSVTFSLFTCNWKMSAKFGRTYTITFERANFCLQKNLSVSEISMQACFMVQPRTLVSEYSYHQTSLLCLFCTTLCQNYANTLACIQIYLLYSYANLIRVYKSLFVLLLFYA